MHSAINTPAVHAGNYYTSGVERVLAKLPAMGVNVPQNALEATNRYGGLKNAHPFRPIELAMLEWFEARDYLQAQALIHYRPPLSHWQVIRVLDERLCPSGISFNMLCPTQESALGAVLQACEGDAVRVRPSQAGGETLIVNIAGSEVLKIEPITLEPFDRDTRDRVRTAFKGVRSLDPAKIRARAGRLPGFGDLRYEERPSDSERPPSGCLLFGFPTNWAFAMRSALKQVGIEVKQSQAQELAAVFFGAGSWHQLISHDDEPSEESLPVGVTYDTPVGPQERYYQSPEEAIFAVGAIAKNYPEEVVWTGLSHGLDQRLVAFYAVTKRELATVSDGSIYGSIDCRTCITCGQNDYWHMKRDGDPALEEAVVRLLEIGETV